MISFENSIAEIENSRTDYQIMHNEWIKLVTELKHRFSVTPFTLIFTSPSTRTIFRELIDKILSYEFELILRGDIGCYMSTLLGFDCECSSCKYGPVILNHMLELTNEQKEFCKNNGPRLDNCE